MALTWPHKMNVIVRLFNVSEACSDVKQCKFHSNVAFGHIKELFRPLIGL